MWRARRLAVEFDVSGLSFVCEGFTGEKLSQRQIIFSGTLHVLVGVSSSISDPLEIRGALQFGGIVSSGATWPSIKTTFLPGLGKREWKLS